MPELFHQLAVSKVVRQTEDAVAISFDVPSSLKEVFRYQPGQYVTLQADIDGQTLRRSYSIAAGPQEPLTIGVKKVDQGRFSTFAQALEPGATLEVMAPGGRFTSKSEQNLLLIAAGSGVTPMISIASHALARGADVTLVFGNRRTSSIMFRPDLNALKNRYMSSFRLVHVLSAEPQDVELLNGRIDANKIDRLARAGALDLSAVDGVFICGPGQMLDEVSGALIAAGVTADRIHTERFFQEGEKPRASSAAKAVALDGVQVEVILDGTHRTFSFETGDDSVLDAASRHGLDLPYSCKGGMCSTCRCRVASGSAEMALNFSLEPWELDAGFTLACQARPTSEKLILDFDAA